MRKVKVDGGAILGAVGLWAAGARDKGAADAFSLGLDPALHFFTSLVGLVHGACACAGPCSDKYSSASDFSHIGQAVLLWLECQVENFILPDGFERKNSDFVREAQAPSKLTIFSR